MALLHLAIQSIPSVKEKMHESIEHGNRYQTLVSITTSMLKKIILEYI